MKLEHFEKILNEYRKSHNMISELYDIGFDLMEGKYKLSDSLFLLFDKNVEDFKLSFKQSITLINNWIKVFVDLEEYEIANAFKSRKIRKWRKWRKIKRIWSFKLFYRVWRLRLHKLFKMKKPIVSV